MSYFDDGIKIAKAYYTRYHKWNVHNNTVYNGFELGMWWCSVRHSIKIGSLTDDKVERLRETEIEFDIKPLYQEQWMEMFEEYCEENNKTPRREEVFGDGYGIGRWYKRQVRLNTDYGKSILKKKDKVNDEDWLIEYKKFKEIWMGIVFEMSYKIDRLEEYNHAYLWGRKEILVRPKGEREKKRIAMLNEIRVEWQVHEYDKKFIQWILRKRDLNVTIDNKYDRFFRVWKMWDLGMPINFSDRRMMYDILKKIKSVDVLSLYERTKIYYETNNYKIENFECRLSKWRYNYDLCSQIIKSKEVVHFGKINTVALKKWYINEKQSRQVGWKKIFKNIASEQREKKLFENLEKIEQILKIQYYIKSEIVDCKKFDFETKEYIQCDYEKADIFEVRFVIDDIYSPAQIKYVLERYNKNFVEYARMQIISLSEKEMANFQLTSIDTENIFSPYNVLENLYKLNKFVYERKTRSAVFCFDNDTDCVDW